MRPAGRPHPGGVSSFGMPAPAQQQPDQVVMIPPIMLDSVQLPVVLVVDAESLNRMAETITEMVTTAVRSAFVRAIKEIQDGTEEPFEDPEPDLDQLGTPKPL